MKRIIIAALLASTFALIPSLARASCTYRLLFDKNENYIGCRVTTDGRTVTYNPRQITEFGCGSVCEGSKPHVGRPRFEHTSNTCSATPNYDFIGKRYSGCTTVVQDKKTENDPASMPEIICKSYCSTLQTKATVASLQSLYDRGNYGYKDITEACGQPEPGYYMDIVNSGSGVHCESKVVGTTLIPDSISPTAPAGSNTDTGKIGQIK